MAQVGKTRVFPRNTSVKIFQIFWSLGTHVVRARGILRKMRGLGGLNGRGGHVEKRII